ncbi:hypothetical protein [Chryseobacterium indoltheticum]|uniref:hypothetical protein n=1 Tax=Chryseobacterium indoltheticum TaxID=254 RepID=UPI003F499A55
MVLIMQWKAMKDKEYLKTNISRMQTLVRLKMSDYFNSDFSVSLKRRTFSKYSGTFCSKIIYLEV